MPRASPLVVQLPMTLGEGPTDGILAAEADWCSFRKKRCEGESFTRCPVEALAGFDREAPLFQETSHLGIEGEPRGNLRQQPAQAPQLIQRHPCFRLVQQLGRGARAKTAPRALEPIGAI